MSNLQAILQNALTADNVEDCGIETTLEDITHWQRICATGLAAISASSPAWLQLLAGSTVLNCNDVGISSAEKTLLRRSMLKHLFQSENSCSGLLRMSPVTFSLLCGKLQRTGRLSSHAHISPDEQVATFLFIIGQKFSNRAISFFMSRSGETCNRYFRNVLHALISLSSELMKQPNENEISNVIRQSRRFYPYFKDCLGALDGTHVRVKVPKHDAARYRGRKDFPTQNVLVCCTFDMRITYVLAGWEGSASDSRVLKSTLTREDALRIPNGKYYLGDAGFGLSNKVLVPYGRTRYLLKEYAVRGPENAKELFNLRHASLRNCIERCFGIMKKMFPIIWSGAECHYSCSTMTDIILACCNLYNFLLTTESALDIPEDMDAHIEPQYVGDVGDSSCPTSDEVGDYSLGKDLRDAIASEMWKEYELDVSLEHRGD